MIYLDNAATTKPSLSALKKAETFLTEEFFNPSALYRGGLNCASQIKDAKACLLKRLGVSETEYEVIWTSCGTESDNFAVLGANCKGAYVTDMGEHSAVYKSFCELERQKKQVFYIGLNSDGSVDTEKLYDTVAKENVSLVSVMHVNNETGAINDIKAIANRIKKINPAVIFHSDGVQAFGKIPFRLSADIDAYSISAHKINALKGTGALIKKKRLPLKPLLIGGGQENGLRSGTENVYGIKVFQYATEEKYSDITVNYDRIMSYNKYVEDNLDKDIFTVISGENRSPYIISVSARGLKGEVLMHSLEQNGIIVGNGSACSSRNRFSRVIQACGYGADVLDGVLRVSFSTDTTKEEVTYFVEKANENARRLKDVMK